MDTATPFYPWISDLGDGTYRNPILFADYSDPDVIRHGDDFYMVASSFNCTPGLPILHSRDLVNWTLINHAVQNLPHPRFTEVQHGCGVWAPSIRFHAGKFWIFFPMPDEGIYVTTATDPAGEWSEPHMVQEGVGLIDPCPLWDDDGQAYLVFAWARSRCGKGDFLQVAPMAPDASRLLGEGMVVFEEPERHPFMEGPKFHKENGYYYILTPAGGVPTGWQVVLRSRNIYGPYEEKTLLARGSTDINGPHQGALVDLPNGEWWFLHFQDLGVYGRIVHLQPVEWEDGWPLMGINQNANGTGEPVLRYRKPDVGAVYPVALSRTTDEFDDTDLGLQWQWHANHEKQWYSLEERPGYLRLFARFVPEGNFLKAPNLLLQKFPAPEFTVETQLEFSPAQIGEQAGLVVMGLEHAALSIRKTEQGNRIVFQVNNAELFSESFHGATLVLRVAVGEGGLCSFSFAQSSAQPFTQVVPAFQAREGKWIGAKVGAYSFTSVKGASGYTDVAYFRFQ